MENLKYKQTPEAPSKDSAQMSIWSGLPPELRLMVYKYVFNKSVLNIETSGDVVGRTYMKFIERKLNCRLIFGSYDDHMIAPMITYRVKSSSNLAAWLIQRPEYQMLIEKLIIYSGRHGEEGADCLHTFKRSPCFYASSSWFNPQELSLKPVLPWLTRLCFEVHESQVVKKLPKEASNTAVYETLVEWKKDIARLNPGVIVRLK